MRIIYTEHAEESIKERKLSKDIIESVLINPENIVNASFGRKIAQKVIGNKLLRIIYEIDSEVYIIITAYYTNPER